MSELTMCGYRCDLCKAFAANIHKNDQRKSLSEMWGKYFSLAIPADEIYCDGCRCEKPGAKRIDVGCPVRECVLAKKISHCGDCVEYPCDTFHQREGISIEDAKRLQGECFDLDEFSEYLRAYDNKTALAEYRAGK